MRRPCGTQGRVMQPQWLIIIVNKVESCGLRMRFVDIVQLRFRLPNPLHKLSNSTTTCIAIFSSFSPRSVDLTSVTASHNLPATGKWDSAAPSRKVASEEDWFLQERGIEDGEEEVLSAELLLWSLIRLLLLIALILLLHVQVFTCTFPFLFVFFLTYTFLIVESFHAWQSDLVHVLQ